MEVWIEERIEFAVETPLQRDDRERERICGFSKTRGEEEGKVWGRKDLTVEIC